MLINNKNIDFLSMSDLDHETIILINQNDLNQGFFRFSTTRFADYKRLLKIVGNENNLLSLKTNINKGKVIEWLCQIPIDYLDKNSWKIRRKVKHTLTNDQKEAMRERFNKIRKKP